MARKRKKAVARSKRAATNPVSWQLIVAGIIVAGLGFLVTDSLGFDLLGVGAAIWLLAFGLAFMLTAIYNALFLTPASWRAGIELLWSNLAYGLNHMFDTVPTKRRIVPASKGDAPASFATIRAGILPSHISLALARGVTYSRAAGPGYALLQKGESIHDIVDLRRHLRHKPISVRSRDGIALESELSIIFELQRKPFEENEINMPYGYDPEAIFKVGYGGGVDDNLNALPWTERIISEVEAAVIAELSRHTLDELQNPGGVFSLADMKAKVLEQMQEKLSHKGVSLHYIGLAQIKIDSQISEQRLLNWQAHWQSEMNLMDAEKKAMALNLHNEARRRVQGDLINNIAQTLQRIQQSNIKKSSELFLLQVVNAMEQSILDEQGESQDMDQLLGRLADIQQLLASSDETGQKPLPSLEAGNGN